MARYNKFNIVYQLQKWMDSVAGQTFMNYAYSWGAAIVILGTLFKLTHLPGANFMLFIGMGTEVFVFFISAFDRPFDKTQEGRDLATDSQIEAALTAQAAIGSSQAGNTVDIPEDIHESKPAVAAINIPAGSIGSAQASPVAGGTIIIGGGAIGGSNQATTTPQTTSEAISFAAGQDGQQATATPSTQIGTPAPAVTPETAQAMEQATSTYVDRLNELNDLLLKIGAVSERLSIDSQEMENLNRTLTGIARVYEMQLKSASQQITTQDEINAETRKMAEEIKELNAVYARMINAMTVNIPKQ